MTLQECLEWQRLNCLHIDRLAKNGDREAKKLIFTYQTLYDHRTDVKLQNEFIRCCEEFIRRDLTVTERADLQNKFGHKLADSER